MIVGYWCGPDEGCEKLCVRDPGESRSWRPTDKTHSCRVSPRMDRLKLLYMDPTPIHPDPALLNERSNLSQAWLADLPLTFMPIDFNLRIYIPAFRSTSNRALEWKL